MTTETAYATGLRVQITGPDVTDYTDCTGLVGTIQERNDTTGNYLVSYYMADIRQSNARYFPPESIELIDVS